MTYVDPSGYQALFSYSNIQKTVSQVGTIGLRHISQSAISGGIGGLFGYLAGTLVYNVIAQIINDHTDLNVPLAGFDMMSASLNAVSGMWIGASSTFARYRAFTKLDDTLKQLDMARDVSTKRWFGAQQAASLAYYIRSRFHAYTMLASLTSQYAIIATFFTGLSNVAGAILPDEENLKDFMEWGSDLFIEFGVGLVVGAPLAGIANTASIFFDFAQNSNGFLGVALPISVSTATNAAVIGFSNLIALPLDASYGD